MTNASQGTDARNKAELDARIDAEIDAQIDTLAPLIAIAVADAWRPGVAGSLRMARAAAALLENFEFDDRSDEIAPVFVAGDS